MLIRLFQQTTMGRTAHSGLTPRYGAELKQPDKQESSIPHESVPGAYADGHDIRVMVLLVADRGGDVPQEPQ